MLVAGAVGGLHAASAASSTAPPALGANTLAIDLFAFVLAAGFASRPIAAARTQTVLAWGSVAALALVVVGAGSLGRVPGLEDELTRTSPLFALARGRTGLRRLTWRSSSLGCPSPTMYTPSPLSSKPQRASRFPGGAVLETRLDVSAALPFLRRVYALFTGGVLLAVVGALVALYAGEPVMLDGGAGAPVAVSPIVAFGLQHWFVMTGVFFVAFLGAQFARRIRGLNVVALFAYTFVTGLYVAPSIFLAQAMASHGGTLDPSPVRDAFLLTAAAFVGLSGYVFVSRKDFSYLGAALNMGMWVVLGAMVLGFFFHSAVFQLAIASVGVLLFCGYILFDTSRMMRGRVGDDAVGAALGLFLDVVNLFLFLLRILSSRRS